MMRVRLTSLPAFEIIGRKVWIAGQDNDLFGRFWEQSRADGYLEQLRCLQSEAGITAGPRTGGAVLGVSRVEINPVQRAFYYMIAIETPPGISASLPDPLMERFTVPAAQWAVFECHGSLPEALVTSEMYAFLEWLPGSGFQHALAPEMEVYPPYASGNYCEFWLPLDKNENKPIMP